MKIMSDNVQNAGQSTMGTDIPFENVSGSVPTVDNYRRPAQSRNALGRFAARSSRQISTLGPPGGIGQGGIDATSGRWVPGVENRSVLHRQDDGWALEQVHRVAPDYSYFVPEERKSHDEVHAAQDDINHRMSCPLCTVLGA